MNTANDSHALLTSLLTAIVFTLVLAVTNNRFDPDPDVSWIVEHGGADAIDYWHIARAAPERPDQEIPYHRAQRWLYPYLAGLAAKSAGVESWHLLYAVNLVLAAVSVMLFLSIVRHFVSSTWHALVATAMVAFNPYLYRFYLAFPGMLTDAVFVLGELVVVLGLIKARLGWLIAGLVIAICARQTALAMLPGVLGFILTQSPPSRSQRLMVGVLAVAVCVAAYWYLGRVAAEFSAPDSNLRYLTGIFSNAARGPDPSALLQLCGLWLFGFALLAVFFLAALPLNLSSTALWLIVIGFGVALQPVLAGPQITGGAVQRLAVLGLPALAAGLLAAVGNQTKPARTTLILTLPVIVAGSLHHTYSVVGPDAALRIPFAALFLCSALFLFFAVKTSANAGAQVTR